MTPEDIGLKKDWTGEQAFELIRKVAIDKETSSSNYLQHHQPVHDSTLLGADTRDSKPDDRAGVYTRRK